MIIEPFSQRSNMEFWPVVKQHIIDCWVSRGGGEDIEDYLNLKETELKAGKFIGVCVKEGKLFKGLALVDKITPHYGNVIVHALDPKYRGSIATALMDQKAIQDCLVEVIQFEDTEDYRNGFRALELPENKRMRMVKYLEEPVDMPELPSGFELSPLTRGDIEEASTVSYFAHKVSKDYEGYRDLESVENRVALETRVFDNIYGRFYPKASYMLRYNGMPVGMLSTVVIPCWGYEKVPWIFDVSISPEYHNKGLGRFLMSQVIYDLQDNQFPLIGLAVTLDNYSAIHLYESLGFEEVEPFSEFIGP